MTNRPPGGGIKKIYAINTAERPDTRIEAYLRAPPWEWRNRPDTKTVATKGAYRHHLARIRGTNPGFRRAERVIRFAESLPCTSGPIAGTLFKLRPWQKKFIRAVYRTDKAGKRLVRTAVL